MGIADKVKTLRTRAKSAWRAWRGQGQQPVVKESDIERQLQLTAEDLDAEARETLLQQLTEDNEADFEALNASFRGGNGKE